MTFEINLPGSGPAVLEIMDIAGRRVSRVDVTAKGPGRHVISPAIRQPGVYFARLRQGDHMVRATGIYVR